MSGSGRASVLIVEDEPAVARSFEMMLEDTYDVEMVGGGPEALEKIDDSVDVVLLDRMMPGMSGEEVLARIRDAGVDCRVAMVTAVAPDLDIIGMGFDAYVTKPSDEEELKETVESLLERSGYDDDVRRYYSVSAQIAALQEEKTMEELRESEEYRELESQREELRRELNDSVDRLLDDAEFMGSLRDLTGDGSGGEQGERGE